MASSIATCNPVVADACGTALLPVAGDAMHHLAEAGQLFDINVDQVTRRLALVALHQWLGDQVSQPAQSQAVQGPVHGGEGSGQQPGEVTQMQPLMVQLHSALEAAQIERPLMGATNTASIPPGRLDHLSDSGPATCKHSAGRSPLLPAIRPEGGDGEGVD